jgi:hypothetical protein
MKTQKIDSNYKYFQSQENDESVVFVIRKHWTALIFPVFFGLIFVLVTILMQFLVGSVISDRMSEAANTIATCIFSLVYLFALLYVFISWLVRYLSVVILTNEHLVEVLQLSLFSRKVSELDLDSIEDATCIQSGFFPTIFRFGDVLIQTAGELPNFNLKNIGDPEEVQQKIMEVKESFMKTNHFNGADPLAFNQDISSEKTEQNS